MILEERAACIYFKIKCRLCSKCHCSNYFKDHIIFSWKREQQQRISSFACLTWTNCKKMKNEKLYFASIHFSQKDFFNQHFLWLVKFNSLQKSKNQLQTYLISFANRSLDRSSTSGDSMTQGLNNYSTNTNILTVQLYLFIEIKQSSMCIIIFGKH